jgi:hypothetical protein
MPVLTSHQFTNLFTVYEIPLIRTSSYTKLLLYEPPLHQSKILKRKSVRPLNAMEKQILEVVSIFNSQFGSIYENCQANHKEFFKSLPLEIDCLVLKVYVGAE